MTTMLSSLMSLRLAKRKRGSATPEADSTSTAVAPESKEHSLAISKGAPSATSSPRRDIKPMPTPPSSRKKPRSNSISRFKTPAPERTPDPPEKVALDALKRLVRSCPPKSFQSSLVLRLDSATPEQVSIIAELLEGLSPPPTLHCARCHASYLEEENYERCCVMDHDDNSTSVKFGETHWGCCDQTSEAQEPLVGWCYEGRHIDDRVEARYRKDFEDDDEEDGLQSCKKKGCNRSAEDAPAEVHVVVTRGRGARPPPSKKKKTI